MNLIPPVTDVININEAVTVTMHGSIAAIEMAERTSKNTLSMLLVEGIVKAFKLIPTIVDAKVVLIHGYGNYFCCGGTQQELLDLSHGLYDFTKINIYRCLLDCPLPTIAAMSGHGIGGGFTFGCFADMVVMAEEACYTTNYMNYGFTPGFGTTYILPIVLGDLIANEMMYTGRNFRGIEFKERGVGARIVKKKQVIETAFSIATEITQKTRISLELLKLNQVGQRRIDLQSTIDAELVMHKESFKQPEVAERIQQLFHK